MSTATKTAKHAKKRIGNDDYSLRRVPENARYGFGSMLLQWLAQSGSLSQFVLGATLGVGMRFSDAFWAFTLGAVILEVVIFLIGLAGQREGLTMTMLTRFTGFGRNGSALVSLVIAISLVGWFGVQNGIFGKSMHALVGGPPWLWCAVSGVVLTLLVIYGFKYMMWLAKIAVPLFFGLVAWSVISTLSDHSVGALMSAAPTATAISIPAAATIIAGGYMTGAVVAPDMTRFNRKGWHVLLQSSASMVLSEYIVGMTGVLLGHLVGSSDVTHIVLSTSGFVGLIVVVLATAKINDWNLYGSSLGVVNFVRTVFGRPLHRGVVTLVIGIAGTVLSAIGFLQHFTAFLSVLGVAIPPVGGIIVAEYFLVRGLSTPLRETRAAGRVPASMPVWVPATLAVWAAAFCVGEFVHWGIPALNSLLTAAILYTVLGRAGLIRPVGSAELEEVAR
ncbi:cytosine permease [Amycolatopsis sp. Poz14]|uniref:cytosine permease n=1 Tax=Amycolatopsis sp. Poz14 TaxID=1447705 RepID=UPI00056815C5|nr:cytosine permease [Amycolatopsis sp. Poz14]MCG3754440.1 cytosine permease [Amycolatopsis sp. Poz14]